MQQKDNSSRLSLVTVLEDNNASFSLITECFCFSALYLQIRLTPSTYRLLEQLDQGWYHRGDAKGIYEIELMRGIHVYFPVGIVDEAHLLDKEMLEVRFLPFSDSSPMALILVGNQIAGQAEAAKPYAIRRGSIFSANWAITIVLAGDCHQDILSINTMRSFRMPR